MGWVNSRQSAFMTASEGPNSPETLHREQVQKNLGNRLYKQRMKDLEMRRGK